MVQGRLSIYRIKHGEKKVATLLTNFPVRLAGGEDLTSCHAPFLLSCSVCLLLSCLACPARASRQVEHNTVSHRPPLHQLQHRKALKSSAAQESDLPIHLHTSNMARKFALPQLAKQEESRNTSTHLEHTLVQGWAFTLALLAVLALAIFAFALLAPRPRTSVHPLNLAHLGVHGHIFLRAYKVLKCNIYRPDVKDCAE